MCIRDRGHPESRGTPILTFKPSTGTNEGRHAMRIRKYLAGSIVGLALVGAAAAGQSAADAFFVAKDWTHAAPAYEEIVAHDPADALAWYRLGMSRHQLRQYPQAAAAYEKAVALPSAPRGVRYNLACVYALMNRMDDAFRTCLLY